MFIQIHRKPYQNENKIIKITMYNILLNIMFIVYNFIMIPSIFVQKIKRTGRKSNFIL